MFAHMNSLHTSMNTAHSGCKPSTFMSSSTHSFQVFLFLPLTSRPYHLHLSTGRYPGIVSTLLWAHQAMAQTTGGQIFYMLLSLLYTIFLAPMSYGLIFHPMWKDYKSALRILSFSNTPHIHLTIIHSVLTRLQICFLHRSDFSPICQYTLDTSLVYLSLYLA